MNYIDTNSSLSSSKPRDITVNNVDCNILTCNNIATNIVSTLVTNPSATSSTGTMTSGYMHAIRVGNNVIANFVVYFTPNASRDFMNFTFTALPYVGGNFTAGNFGLGTAHAYGTGNVLFNGNILANIGATTITVEIQGPIATSNQVDVSGSFSYPII